MTRVHKLYHQCTLPDIFNTKRCEPVKYTTVDHGYMLSSTDYDIAIHTLISFNKKQLVLPILNF